MSMKKRILPCLVVVLLFAFAASGISAHSSSMGSFNQVAKTLGQPTRSQLNINLLAHWIYADGTSAHNPHTNGNGIYFPRGTYGAGVIYIDGLLWGGFVKDGQQPELRVGGSTYNTGMIQGAIESKGVAEDPEDADVRIWRIRQDYKTADLRQDAAEMEEMGINDVADADIADLRAQYETDWNEWPVEKGAPFYDVNGNGRLDAGVEEDLNGNGVIDLGEREEPGLAGADQVLWFAANDLTEGRTLGLYGSPPIGIELQFTMWGYNRTDAMGNVAFKKYKVIYKGTSNTTPVATIDSCFFAVWSDPDCGEYSDDLVGCDTLANLMYVYNSVTQDVKFTAFGLAPPSGGYDFLQGPIVEGADDDVAIFDGKLKPGYRNLGMTYFNYFAAGGTWSDPDLQDYGGTEQWYNLMNGLTPRGGIPYPLMDGETPTRYPLSGDPVAGVGDVDGVLLPPGDRRCQMITGPITLAFGDTQEVVVAFVTGLGADRLSSINVMKYNDISAQYAYDNFFELAKAPAAPQLKISNFDRKILLNWGWDEAGISATEDVDQNGYLFEGYNVYQLPTPSSPLSEGKKIATFDVANEVTVILDALFDESSGQILQSPAQIGTNSGITRTLEITKNAFTSRPLVNGTPYYFAVTAYSYNGDQTVPIHTLESSPLIKQAIPQTTVPGVRLQHEVGEAVDVEHDGPSDGSVEVAIVDPTITNGHTYEVTFADVEGSVQWMLKDATTDETKLAAMTNQTTAQSNTIIDGFDIKVLGPPTGMNTNKFGVAYGEGSATSAAYLAGWDFDGNRWIGGYDWGGAGLFGGMANGADFFGSTLGPADYVDIKVDFTSDPNMDDESKWSNVAVYRRDLGYALNGAGKAPMVAWDTSVDPPRRINICIVEHDGVTNASGDAIPANNIWDMAWNGSEFADLGGREYIFFMLSDYASDPTTVYDDDAMWGPAADVLYAIWPQARGSRAYLLADFWISVFASKVNYTSDTFTFTTNAPAFDKKTAGVDVEKINVYPNPYYGVNPREQTAVDRFVSFNHLPEKATFRIFDLAGTLVVKLEKDDPSQFFRWDLRNHNELPVASGIYIIHIEMPDLDQTKILKAAVVREAEFLEVF